MNDSRRWEIMRYIREEKQIISQKQESTRMSNVRKESTGAIEGCKSGSIIEEYYTIPSLRNASHSNK